VPIGQGHLRRKFGHAARIHHGIAALAAQLRPPGFDEVGGQPLAHKLGFCNARIALNAKEKKVEFKRGPVAGIENILHDLARVGRGHNFFQIALAAHKSGGDIRVDFSAACQQHNLAVASVFFVKHGYSASHLEHLTLEMPAYGRQSLPALISRQGFS